MEIVSSKFYALSSSSPSCSLFLRIMLIDEFGDGWDGLWLYINHSGYVSSSYRPSRPDPNPNPEDEGVYFSSSTHAPSYGANPLLFTVCASLHQDRFRDRGRYTLEIKHDSSARNNWEILWQVSTLTKEYNDWVYGDHRTKVEYTFGDDGLFHLDKVDRPLAHPEHCSRCTPPPPPPPPSSKDNDVAAPNPDTPQPPPTYPVPFELSDSEGDGWFSDWRGAKYSISDKSKTKLLDSGSICGPEFKEPCEARLPDGDYYFRVGGAGDDSRDEMSWKFCGRGGTAMQELSFAIIHGKCVPGHLSNAVDMIGAEEQTMITLRGELLLENVFTSDLSTSEARIFESVIAQELGVSSQEVMILSVCHTRPGVFCSEDANDDDSQSSGSKNSRRLSAVPPASVSHEQRSLSATYVLDVVFLVTMVAEKYNKVGSQYHAMQDLVSGVEKVFDNSLKSGQLQSSLRSAEQESLSYVRLKHFVPLKHTDVSYRFVSLTNAPTALPPSDHLTVEHVVLDESLEQAALLATPLLFVGLAILAIALVVLRDRWAKQAELLSLSALQDSDRLPLKASDPASSVGAAPEEEDGELSFELRSDLSFIPTHNSSRSRYRPKEGSSLSHDHHDSSFSRTVSHPLSPPSSHPNLLPPLGHW
jgi:hypothetical protein